MAQCERAARPLLHSLRQSYNRSLPVRQFQQSHGFSSTAAAGEEAAQAEAQKVPFYKAPDPELVSSPRLERRLVRAGTPPIGSRRRRVALQSSANIPLELLPYQCFQEARKVLLEDRAEKLKQIESERDKIARLRATDAEQVGGELRKQNRLRSMEKYLEKLKIFADINDPMVKKRFEDGLGDMNRPIYRYLADQQWRKYRRLVLVQRITQMKVVPDVLPHCDPVADVRLYFAGKQVQPGEFVNSRVSTMPPKLNIQSFQKGEKLVTIAVVDSDVPNLETDGFDHRCHYLAVNVPISPTETKVDLQALSADSQVALPWFPPYSQKGSPYHRLSVFVMEQKDNKLVDHKAVVERAQRENLKLRSFETFHRMKPIGVHLFRSQWDEDTAAVMNEAGIEGADVEFRRKRVEPLPYKRRNLGKYR